MPDGDPPLARRAVRSPARLRTSVTVTRGAVRVPLALERVRDLAELVLRRERVDGAAISIQFVTPRVIARLHEAHLGVRGATDIVTLEHGYPRLEPCGSLPCEDRFLVASGSE